MHVLPPANLKRSRLYSSENKHCKPGLNNMAGQPSERERCDLRGPAAVIETKQPCPSCPGWAAWTRTVMIFERICAFVLHTFYVYLHIF